MVTVRVPLLFALLGTAGVGYAAIRNQQPWSMLGLALLIIAIVVALDLLIAAPPTQVRLSRSGARTVRLGESATVSLTVVNDSVRPMRALIRDAWVPSAAAGSPYAHLVAIDPGEAVTLATALTPVRRGDRSAVRVSIRAYGPFGLAYRQTTRAQSARITPQWSLRALPEFRSRRLLPEKLSRLRVIEGQVVTRGRGQGGEFDSLRDYVVGDDPRAIDWRGTARREHVVVKQWRPERDRRVLCVLDTGRTSAARIADAANLTRPDQGGEPRLDHAIDAALLLASLAAYAGDRVDVLAIDTQVRVRVSASTKRALPNVINALAPLESALVETDFTRVASEVLALERKRALVVLFTTLDPAAIGDGLMPVLSRLVSRHTLLVASVHDPALPAMAAGRAGANEIYTAGAAELGLAELRRVRTALTRSGVHVVDAASTDFASTVCDKYLELKAAGRL